MIRTCSAYITIVVQSHAVCPMQAVLRIYLDNFLISTWQQLPDAATFSDSPVVGLIYVESNNLGAVDASALIEAACSATWMWIMCGR